MEDLPPKFNVGLFLQKYRYYLLIVLVGLIFVGGGILFFKKDLNFTGTKVEILQTSDNRNLDEPITAEISGAVINPGVYKMIGGSRIDDLLVAAGGFSANADRVWSDKYLNRAAKITDGQKVYIPSVDEHSEVLSAKTGVVDQSVSLVISTDSNSLININTGSITDLDSLPGIGPVYAQKIIDHRPYSKPEDLVSSGALTQTLYEKIKNSVTVY